MSTYQETFESFSLKAGLLDKAEQIDAIEDAALKAVSIERCWKHIADVTKWLAGYYAQDGVGLLTTNHYRKGPPIVTGRTERQPNEGEDRCCRPWNYGIGDGGISQICGKFVFGDFTEKDMAILTEEKSSAQAMLALFTDQWVYGMENPMIIQKSGSKWVEQSLLHGISERMNQMVSVGLPPKTKKKGQGAPVVHSGESMAAKAARIRKMGGQDTAQPAAQPAAPVNPLAGFRA